jgi:hypothetical protein
MDCRVVTRGYWITSRNNFNRVVQLTYCGGRLGREIRELRIVLIRKVFASFSAKYSQSSPTTRSVCSVATIPRETFSQGL